MQQLQPNTLLQGGKYRIERVLGQGGFGITYLAEQPMLGREVAVKEFFMKEHCNRDESTSMVSVPSTGSVELVKRFREKFLKEARMIAGMDNHHIVRIYDIFEENGTAYYVMENLNGGSLDDKVNAGAISETGALKYIREIADALRYIHSQNVLHLDVKPSNVLIRSNGETVLIDFGISKRYDDEGGQTSTTPAGISKGYAPTEQYNQGVTNFSPATDIYSLGATLYKLVSGKTPPEASLLLNEDEELVRPAGISFSTWTAIEKAMEPRRKRRPQTIDEFLSLIDSKQTSTPVTQPAQEETIAIQPNDEETIIAKPVADDAAAIKGNGTPQQQGTNANLTFNIKGVEFKMIRVEGGTFDMKEEQSCGFLGLSTKEVVQRTTLSDYWIGETQVTQALWKAVMGSNPSYFKGDNKPVECVSWNDCQEFVSKLSKLTGKKFRLPTEAEWEFAARGGNESNSYMFSGSNVIGNVAWCDSNSGDVTHNVATKQANELGIYDMSGNVWEWCSDWYGDYNNSSQTNPVGASSGSDRVNRGGSWSYSYYFCRSSYRSGNVPDYWYFGLGLRLALSE